MSRSLLLLSLLLVSGTAAAVPLTIGHQGRLLDAAGAPLVGPHDLTVALYDAPAGGAPLWSDTFAGVPHEGGYFSVVLGSGAPLSASDLAEDDVWVELAVDGAPPVGRFPLSSVPFAIRAGVATDVIGGVVDVSEVRVGGTTMLDSSGYVGSGSLAGVSCLPDEAVTFDGSAWGCVEVERAHEHDAADVVSGTFEAARLPVGTGSAEVAAGDHGHALDSLAGTLSTAQLPSDLASTVEGWVTDGALDLASGTTVGGADISTGAHYGDGQAVAAMGAKSATNALNHDRYSNGEAVTAMGAKGNSNALNHDRYTDTEARAAARGRYNWAVCQTDADNGNDVGTVIMTCPFTKEANDSFLKVTYSDNMRVYGHGGWCQWEVEFDNQRCSGPTPAIRAAVYSTNDNGVRNNNHEARTVVGVCDTVPSGRLNAGSHSVRVRISDGNTDCYTGWNQTSILMIEEILR